MHWTFFRSGTKRFVGEKKKNKQTNWEEEDDKVGAMRSWNSKLATQHRSPITAFIFVFYFYFFFFSFSFFFPWRLSWFLSLSGLVLNSFFLSYVSNGIGSRDLTWKNLEPFLHVLGIGNKKTFDFWNWQNVSTIRFVALSLWCDYWWIGK